MTVEEQLEAMREPAPATVLPAVLLESALADGYVSYMAPTGTMLVAYNGRGISSIDLSGNAADFERRFGLQFGRPAFPVKSLPPLLARGLDKAITTHRLGNLRIDWSEMSEFQQAVLRKTAEILPGEVRPYSWVAKEIGKPKAVRAVGTALARNPVPLVVPCHRVVRNDNRLGNYYYGTDMKRSILEAEGLNVSSLEERAGRGIRLVGTETTNIFCHPTCRDARRTIAEHEVEFRNSAEARAAGYRPCLHCRPEVA